MEIGDTLTNTQNLRSLARTTYDRFLVPHQTSNKTFYSFGGLKNI